MRSCDPCPMPRPSSLHMEGSRRLTPYLPYADLTPNTIIWLLLLLLLLQCHSLCDRSFPFKLGIFICRMQCSFFNLLLSSLLRTLALCCSHRCSLTPSICCPSLTTIVWLLLTIAIVAAAILCATGSSPYIWQLRMQTAVQLSNLLLSSLPCTPNTSYECSAFAAASHLTFHLLPVPQTPSSGCC